MMMVNMMMWMTMMITSVTMMMTMMITFVAMMTMAGCWSDDCLSRALPIPDTKVVNGPSASFKQYFLKMYFPKCICQKSDDHSSRALTMSNTKLVNSLSVFSKCIFQKWICKKSLLQSGDNVQYKSCQSFISTWHQKIGPLETFWLLPKMCDFLGELILKLFPARLFHMTSECTIQPLCTPPLPCPPLQNPLKCPLANLCLLVGGGKIWKHLVDYSLDIWELCYKHQNKVQNCIMTIFFTGLFHSTPPTGGVESTSWNSACPSVIL